MPYVVPEYKLQHAESFDTWANALYLYESQLEAGILLARNMVLTGKRRRTRIVKLGGEVIWDSQGAMPKWEEVGF